MDDLADVNVFIVFGVNMMKEIKYGKKFMVHFSDGLGRGFTVKGVGR